ncbi:PTS sorbitol transporter [Salmonella enterica]|nr:PTS sorbitol transporter [Salmonella bongori]EBM4472316.1 PTS sorbitol transporter [Salmonella enterica]EEJ3488475.1 PTS sorbitol transporter [Salmonella enterica subsp. arizonae serovar 56:z4,z23:-]EJU7780453.1 PTS sorbitol transporter [Salmonella enterica subsp. arizonae serovar 56:z36:-]HAU2703113.1 PTS sorbitol transporter [Salmonella enterica subsp. arizonae]HCM1861451.1 PTS sorbitol transporter [Salmonella enterica subsp. arizonae serovar 44:z4,z23,z32:-]
MIIYNARIVRTGPFVADGLADNMLITFDAAGPADCLDYALVLSPVFKHPTLQILPGDRLQVAGEEYLITAIGREAQHNLYELGHLTLLFDASLFARHAGCLHLSGTCPVLSDLKDNLVIAEAVS